MYISVKTLIPSRKEHVQITKQAEYILEKITWL